MKEIWKDIPEYEGYYQVSNLGRIRSIKRYVLRCDGRLQFCNGKIIKQRPTTTCHYLVVDLCKNNIRKHYLVHVLVARSFYNNSCNDVEVNHKNGNWLDNRIENLELVTHQENINHSIRHGLKNDYGENSKNAALTNEQAKRIRERHAMGEKQNAIAEEFGVSKQTINNIVHYKTYFK